MKDSAFRLAGKKMMNESGMESFNFQHTKRSTIRCTNDRNTKRNNSDQTIQIENGGYRRQSATSTTLTDAIGMIGKTDKQFPSPAKKKKTE
jgi:hypothetical protein